MRLRKRHLNKLYKVVKVMLMEHPIARNSDEILYLYVIRYLCMEKGLADATKFNVSFFFSQRNNLALPSLESVGRVRRKVQAEYDELKASADIETCRKLLELEYIEFARGGFC